jgi:hypothetical protein
MVKGPVAIFKKNNMPEQHEKYDQIARMLLKSVNNEQLDSDKQ